MPRLPVKCPDCRRGVLVVEPEGSGWKTVVPCPCRQRAPGDAGARQETSTGGKPDRPAPPPGAAGAGFQAPRAWSAAVPTSCGCGRRHPSKVQARVCLTLRAEVESSGGWVLHEVPLVLPNLAPRLAGGSRKRPRPPGAPFVLRVDFLAAWPDGRWKAVEAKTRRVSRDWPARAAAARAWYGRDPLFGGLEERQR